MTCHTQTMCWHDILSHFYYGVIRDVIQVTQASSGRVCQIGHFINKVILILKKNHKLGSVQKV
jgi:hypothetical protein